MLVEEFIFKMENDEEYKNKIIEELKNKTSRHSTEDLLKHKEEIEKIIYDLSMKELIEKLEEYSLLEENWDGYNGEKPNQKVINQAKTFLILLMGKIKHFPKSMISSSGTIGFYFEPNKENYIEIEIEEEIYSYFTKINKTEFSGKDDLLLNDIDLDLIEKINTIYK